jgi:hypothetical protein
MTASISFKCLLGDTSMNSHSRIRRAKDSVEAIMTQKAMGIRSNMIKHNIKWIH